MTEIESRALAHKVAMYCRDAFRMSAYDFEEMVEEGAENFTQNSVREALRQVHDRGELEHLIQWVWDFTNHRKRRLVY